MLIIRLTRIGRKKNPSYRLIVSEKTRDTFGKAGEILGHYHPLDKKSEKKIVLNVARIKYWLSQGAQLSNTVHNLLIEEKIIDKNKKRTIYNYKKGEAKQETPGEEKSAKGEKESKTSKEPKPKTDNK